jgi:hypothetical protein
MSRRETVWHADRRLVRQGIATQEAFGVYRFEYQIATRVAMGCCVVIIALVAHFFTWRRRIRQFLGLPVALWDDDVVEPRFAEVWRARLRRITGSTAGRAGLAAAVAAELAFVVVALPGPNGMIASHREHFREVVTYIASIGHFGNSAAYCRTPITAARTLPKPTGPLTYTAKD